MNNKTIIGGLIAVLAVALVGGIVGAHLFAAPVTGGDFSGGITPQLHAATTTGGLTGNGYIYPAGSLADDAQNGLSVGGSDQYHGLTAYVMASGTPSTAATLAAFGSTTSSASTTITIPETLGLSLGAICSGSTATTTVFISGCILTSTNGVTGTAWIAYTNGTGASLTVPTTTILRISFDQLPY
jgi:hypothetical protein